MCSDCAPYVFFRMHSTDTERIQWNALKEEHVPRNVFLNMKHAGMESWQWATRALAVSEFTTGQYEGSLYMAETWLHTL